MTPEEQQIAIAEFLGAEWRLIPSLLRPGEYRRLLVFPAIYNLDGSECELPKATGEERAVDWEWNVKEHYIPDYPHDANAALEFAQHLASEGWRLNCYTTTDHKQWICIFFRMEMDSFSGCADTMPLAICEAGLRVKGLWHD